MFESGNVAMAYFGSWNLAGLVENEYVAENCDLAVLPSGNDGTRASIYNGLGWAAAENTDMPEEAWALLEYLSTEEVQLKLSKLGVAISAYEGTADAWTTSQPNYNLKAYTEQLDCAVIRPYSKATVIWENMSLEKLVDAFSGAKTVEEVCKEIAATMNGSLAEE